MKYYVNGLKSAGKLENPCSRWGMLFQPFISINLGLVAEFLMPGSYFALGVVLKSRARAGTSAHATARAEYGSL